MTTAVLHMRPIEDIEVGERFRKDLGSIDPLATSMQELGLLHPVVITADGKLIAGARRLEAAKLLGWDEVLVRVAENVLSATEELVAERDENTCRENMKPSEAAKLGIAIEELDADKRLANKLANLARAHVKKRGDDLPPPSMQSLGKARDIVAPAVGMSPQTYSRAKVVVQTAEDENAPEEVREAAIEAMHEMDRTGKVAPSWDRVNEAKKAQPEPGEFVNWDKNSERYKNRVNTIVEGIWGSLNRFEVAAPAIAGVDMEVLTDNLSPAELDDMLTMAANAVKGLKSFQRKLKDHKTTEGAS